MWLLAIKQIAQTRRGINDEMQVMSERILGQKVRVALRGDLERHRGFCRVAQDGQRLGRFHFVDHSSDMWDSFGVGIGSTVRGAKVFVDRQSAM